MERSAVGCTPHQYLVQLPVAPRPATDRLGGPPAVVGRDRAGGRVRRPGTPAPAFSASLRADARSLAAAKREGVSGKASRLCSKQISNFPGFVQDGWLTLRAD